MPTHTHLLVAAAVLVVAIAVVGVAGLVAAWRFGVSDRRGRIPALTGLAALGIGAGFLGSTFQGYSPRVGGSAGGGAPVLDTSASATASSGGPGGVALPVGAVVGLLMLVLVLLLGATLVRTPVGVVVPAVGWLVALSILMYGSQKGDVVLESSGSAELFLFGGLLIAAGIAFATQFQQLKEQVRAQQQLSSSPSVPNRDSGR